MSTTTLPPTKTLTRRAAWTLAALLSAGIALYSARYLLHPPTTPKAALGNPLGAPWLVIHVAGAVTALLLGSLQFLPGLRLTRGHRWIGRTYVLGCLVGGVGGLVLAPGSQAGPIASVGFGVLALVWIAVNLLGWRAALEGRFTDHRRWMIRSWSLTLAAVTLRLYLPLVLALGLPFLSWYRAISFLAWVPNLMIAEVYLRRRAE
ncbi:DUF2306 domain-containing protein [Caulobacter sp. 1776]|uniref:DUF2306 domain-containing protein n=1 Tax=Caulobacter sp. 1776 TaxID=3156420 RepID=UPI00339294F2